MSYAAAIFDMDGTLLNTLDDLAASTNAALAAHGMPPRRTDEVRQFVGNGIANLVRLAVPEGTDKATQDAVFDTFCAHYAEHSADHTAPYPGIMDLLDRLHEAGVRCAVVSNKGDFAVQDLVKLYFPGEFDFAVGERKGIRRKPAPDTVLAALEALDVAPADAVYVGDSEVDVATAEASGLDCIIVTWGFRDLDTLIAAGAEVIVDTCDEVLEQILAVRDTRG
ncbi:MAG: HAD family hydrolase [Atopobiaceae bacterium]|nr:HAD family hydrolase [Atopobiaceae bacterium]